jgi:hypothetical protein
LAALGVAVGGWDRRGAGERKRIVLRIKGGPDLLGVQVGKKIGAMLFGGRAVEP